MDINKYKLSKLNEKHIKNIELIWIESLPENLKSMVGRVIIRNYLSYFFSNKSNLGIGVSSSDKLVGFVLFGKDDKIMKKLFIENFIILMKSFLGSLFFLKLKNIKNFINCAIYVLVSRKQENKLKLNNIELLIICVSKNFQNKGFGTFLIKESFINYDFYFKKFDSVFVKTLKKDTENISFYKKNNFRYLFEIFGRVYLRK